METAAISNAEAVHQLVIVCNNLLCEKANITKIPMNFVFINNERQFTNRTSSLPLLAVALFRKVSKGIQVTKQSSLVFCLREMP